MSDKKRVFFVSAAFGCDRIISCETIQELIDHIEGEYDDGTTCEIGDTITVTIGEMTQQQLDERTEFDGC